jgi:hypothetical protein
MVGSVRHFHLTEDFPMMRSWLRSVFARPVSRPMRQAPARVYLALEGLEERAVPAGIAVTNVNDVVNGDTSSITALEDTPGADGISLREAVTAAKNTGGDNVVAFTGPMFEMEQTITLGSQLDLTNAGSITILGPAAIFLSISGGGASRVFILSSGSANLSGLTITDGSVDGSGGGVLNNGGTIALIDCIVSNNHASVDGANLNNGGGGLYNTGGGTMTLTNCTVSNNDSLNSSFGSAGGGLFNNHGTMTLIDSTITANDALFGGGVLNRSTAGTLSMTNCTISGNTAGEGGGLYNFFGTATLTGCTVSDNTDTGFNGGGGLLNRYGSATLTNCTVSGNTTTGGVGGGIFNSGATSTLTLTNSTVGGNSAPGDVGGGLCNLGIATLMNCTVSGNSATGGGGVFNNLGTLTLGNTIIAGNTGGTEPDAQGVFASRGNNLIGKTDGGSGWLKSDRKGTAAAPLDAKLGELQDNGGPTLTMALLPGSPAIGKGRASLVPEGVTTDQRGAGSPRLVGKLDIGAYEYPAAVASGTLKVVGTSGDDTITIAKVTSRRAVVTLNGTELGTFGGVLRVDVRAGAGDDSVSLTNGFARRATLIAGAGNDTLTGGNGKQLLLGGAGDDVLAGGAGRDVIVGGTGQDNLLGGGGDDLLIADALSYYDEGADSVDTANLNRVMREWFSAASYAKRIQHLTSGGGFSGPTRISSTTVSPDSAPDDLTGDLGRDWFVLSSEDLVIDQADNETGTQW